MDNIKEITTSKFTGFAVLVPEGAINIEVAAFTSGNYVTSSHGLIKIPNGKYSIIGQWTGLTEEQAAEIVPKHVKCFMCGGDGKETCNNPDHGFYSMIGGVVGANESACPCCGHDEDHKVPNGGDCEFCDGQGILEEEKAHEVAEEYGWDNEFEEITFLDTLASLMQSVGCEQGKQYVILRRV